MTIIEERVEQLKKEHVLRTIRFSDKSVAGHHDCVASEEAVAELLDIADKAIEAIELLRYRQGSNTNYSRSRVDYFLESLGEK